LITVISFLYSVAKDASISGNVCEDYLPADHGHQHPSFPDALMRHGEDVLRKNGQVSIFTGLETARAIV
jgi:hypothetical protein